MMMKDLQNEIDACLKKAGIGRYVVLISDPDSDTWSQSYKDAAWSLGACKIVARQIELDATGKDELL